jgi:lipopolysaccharide export system protein LptC
MICCARAWPEAAAMAPEQSSMGPAEPFARRALRVRRAKLFLPLIASILLASLALWPEVQRAISNARQGLIGFKMNGIGAATMVAPRFHGLDNNNQAFAVTADTATRIGPDRVNLAQPKADIMLKSGAWLFAAAPQGVYQQQAQLLDLDGWVTLYRDDGTLMQTEAATLDVRQGAANSAAQTHAEGPFGTLDAQGFTLVDKGNVVQFSGPAKLVLNGAH